MITSWDKAWTALIVGFLSALALQLTGAGEGPTPEQVEGIGSIGSSLIVAAINGFLVWLIPNKATV